MNSDQLRASFSLDTDSNVFLLYIDVQEDISTCASKKPEFVRSVRTARSAALSEVHQMFSTTSRFRGDHVTRRAAMERCLAPRPRILKILVIDDGLPIPLDLYTLPFDIHDNPQDRAFESNWLVRLKSRIDVSN